MRLIPVFIFPLAQCATFHRNDFDAFRDFLNILEQIVDVITVLVIVTSMLVTCVGD